MNELALFAGAGGGILGGHLLGWRTVAAVEIEDYPRRVLLQRQADGILPRFPIWDDVCTFDGKPWRGKVDVISGGFPCQDISCAGKGEGITGSRSFLWGEMARIIREVGPRCVFVENSPILTSRGLGVVLGDLAEMGYDAKWGVLGACDVGADHKRERVWIYANADRIRLKGRRVEKGESVETVWERSKIFPSREVCEKDAKDKLPASYICGENDGVAHRVDRLKAIGNGQVPAVAALAWRILSGLNEQEHTT